MSKRGVPAGALSAGSSLPRKVTAVGTVGAAGQLFTVYERNWNCPACSQENYPSRNRCFRCRARRPEGEHSYVSDPALEALQRGEDIPWQEAIDPNTYQIYYYNRATGVTQWERPAELGPAPLATGWFGRGQAGSGAAEMYKQRNLKYLSRPARKQKDFIDSKKFNVEGANEYNIWYNKFLGDEWDQKLGKEKAPDRCVLETDAGATLADANNIRQLQSGVPMTEEARKKDRRFFCLHFARGMCAKGAECNYYHRVPTLEDDARCDELFDCFGRQRHNKHRDDMNGVGSFTKPCRTLYVAGLLKAKYASNKALEDALWSHFGEWGEVENINVVFRISTAFVRFRVRTSAEFAKEAMGNQSLDHDEILCLRWAHDDPNPVAQDAIDRANRDALFAIMQAKGITMEKAAFEYPLDYSVPDAKKMRLEDGRDVTSQFPELAYPDTDAQYGNGSAEASATTMTPEQYQAYCTSYYASYYAQQGQDQSQPAPAKDQAVTTAPAPSAATATEDVAAAWVKCVDEDTGATYFFNDITQESSWGVPVGYSEKN